MVTVRRLGVVASVGHDGLMTGCVGFENPTRHGFNDHEPTRHTRHKLRKHEADPASVFKIMTGVTGMTGYSNIRTIARARTRAIGVNQKQPDIRHTRHNPSPGEAT